MARRTALFHQLKTLTTEQRNPRSLSIDTLGIAGALALINDDDRRVALAVRKEIPRIATAVEFIVTSFKAGGRLIYVGAGTSGRLGVLDAAECPPTFGSSHTMVQGIVAGGRKAVFRSQEGSEDSERNGARDIALKNVGPRDVVCGIAASMRTPYVGGAVKEAKRRGARTLFVTTNPRSMLGKPAYASLRKAIDVAICPQVGPEIIMGSTRMKSGTAQKLVLNMLTTTAMIQMGKVYGNMMVDLQMTNAKLVERAKKIVMIATGVGYAEAERALDAAGYHVKSAIVMIAAGATRAQARRLLKKSNGFVRTAIAIGGGRHARR
jgi:N-acetylmuramic acid 6-phosphate etherase